MFLVFFFIFNCEESSFAFFLWQNHGTQSKKSTKELIKSFPLFLTLHAKLETMNGRKTFGKQNKVCYKKLTKENLRFFSP